MLEKIREIGASILAVLFLLALVLMPVACCTKLGMDAHEWYVHRNEPDYLVSRMYDPLYAGIRGWSGWPSSPARLEPNGKPRAQYFMLVKEYELRRLGLNPKNHRPYTGELDWSGPL